VFQEWFVTLGEVKGACDAVEAARICGLTDRSGHLLDAIGGLQTPHAKLCEPRAESRLAPSLRSATRG
jgi:hypothetical protein